MEIIPLTIKGAYIIKYEPITDERGFFTRLWDKEALEANGINCCFVQSNLSYSWKAGTFRGFHYQIAPFQENKLVMCLKGSAIDYILDLRPDSPTYKKLESVEIGMLTRTEVYVPEGCGHAFITLVDDTRLIYFVTCKYSKESERGVRWNDPILKGLIARPGIISGKDSTWGDYQINTRG